MRARARVARARELQRQHHVLERGASAGSSWKLWNTKPTRSARTRRARVLVEREQVAAGQLHRAGGGNVQPREQSQQRALARTRGADDRHGLAGLHNEAHVLHDGERVIGRGDLFGKRLNLHNVRLMIQGLHSFVRTALFALVVSLAAVQAAAAPRTLMIFGDSLSAAYNISADQGWVRILGDRIAQAKLPWTVVNASISGETTAGGLRRLAEDLKRHKPAVVVIELGANDALRGQPVAGMRTNLEEMIRLARQARAEPVLVGLMIPPNYGIEYAAQFRDMYPAIARKQKTAFVPFLLEGIADKPELFQADGLHPVAAAEPRVADNVWLDARARASRRQVTELPFHRERPESLVSTPLSLDELSQFGNILDARSPSEFNEDHLPGAHQLPGAGRRRARTRGHDLQAAGRIRGQARGSAARGEEHRAPPRGASSPTGRGTGVRSSIAGVAVDGRARSRTCCARWDGMRCGSKAATRPSASRSSPISRNCPRASLSRDLRRHGLRQEPPARGAGQAGAQVLDLEVLAAHRGSVLGELPDEPQPSQKSFETSLWSSLSRFDPARPVFVESESKKVGNLRVPETLIARMRDSECLRPGSRGRSRAVAAPHGGLRALRARASTPSRRSSIA